MSEQLDRIESKVDQITTVLGGSGMGDKGLIEQHRELKTEFYKTKSEVNKLKWTSSGIAAFISTIWAGMAAWINSQFNS